MEPTYSDDNLESMKAENNKFMFDGKEYNSYTGTQLQRTLEREIRKQRRRRTAYEASGCTTDAAAVGSRLRMLEQKYRDFSAAAGLPLQYDRMQVLYAS